MIIKNQFQLHALLQFIDNNDILAYDIETTGLSTRKDSIIGYAIANDKQGFYVPVKAWNKATETLDNCGISLDSHFLVLQKLATKKLLAFNAAFDLPFTKNNLGVDLLPSLYADVMLMSHTADENRKSYALKEIAADMYGKQAKDEQADMLASIKANGGTAKEYFKADLEPMAIYAVKDAVLTAKLYYDLLPLLEQDGLVDFFFEQEVMPLYREVTIPMEQTGIALDLPYMRSTLEEITVDIEKLEARIQAAIAPHLGIFEQWFLRKDFPYTRSGAFLQMAITYYKGDLPKTTSGAYSVAAKNIENMAPGLLREFLLGNAELPEKDIVAIQRQLWAAENRKYMFNLNSRHHLKKLFFDTLGEKTINRTPTGQNQADEEFVSSMTGKYEWTKDLLVYYKLVKLKGTYIERFLEEQENGRFYPRFLQHRTVSGRMSGDFQQLPRPVEDADENDLVARYTNRIRNFFIADEGSVLIDADYESLEPHIFAHVSNDESIKNIFRKGLDFYSEIAIKTESIQDMSADKKAPNYLGKLDKPRRQTAKAYALGIAYGLTGYKLQYELNIPLPQAEKLVKGYLDAFPSLHAAMKQSHMQCLEQGYVKTQAGRIRRFPRAIEIYQKYGKVILDDLELWKALHDSPGLYERAKVERRELKNYLNNAFNVQIQGLASSVVNKASILLAKAFKHQNILAIIVANVHDELLVSCKAEFATQAAEIMQQIMEHNPEISIPLKAVPNIGQRYGEIK
jgi:DNA polymerase I-like protein with 3'-5' exonuclease and polymerase domains